MKVVKWIKRLFNTISNYERQLTGISKEFREAHREIAELRKVIKARTDLHADIHYKAESHIIAVGRYKDRDYIQTYNVRSGDFEHFIKVLRDMETWKSSTY